MRREEGKVVRPLPTAREPAVHVAAPRRPLALTSRVFRSFTYSSLACRLAAGLPLSSAAICPPRSDRIPKRMRKSGTRSASTSGSSTGCATFSTNQPSAADSSNRSLANTIVVIRSRSAMRRAKRENSHRAARWMYTSHCDPPGSAYYTRPHTPKKDKSNLIQVLAAKTTPRSSRSYPCRVLACGLARLRYGVACAQSVQSMQSTATTVEKNV